MDEGSGVPEEIELRRWLLEGLVGRCSWFIDASLFMCLRFTVVLVHGCG